MAAQVSCHIDVDSEYRGFGRKGGSELEYHGPSLKQLQVSSPPVKKIKVLNFASPSRLKTSSYSFWS